MRRPSGGVGWWAWLAAWGLAASVGLFWLVDRELGRLRDAFETDGRIAHRLLSQRATEHEAVLATLALFGASSDDEAVSRLPAVYPRVLSAVRRTSRQAWPQAGLDSAEATSRSRQRAVVVAKEFAGGRFWLVMAGESASHALLIDVAAMIPAEEWPIAPTQPVSVRLRHGEQSLWLQQGVAIAGVRRFEFAKPLASPAQPFEFAATRTVGWSELPWVAAGLWLAATGLAFLAAGVLQRQLRERRRAEERLRIDRVARLNALGELAAGMAHELNQPLTAVLASTRAASRLLDDEPPGIDGAREAMTRAAAEARRAADVLSRLRRSVEQPSVTVAAGAVDLRSVVDAALQVLEPECRRCGVAPRIQAGVPVVVVADAVALEQIVHNLLQNALQALSGVPGDERSLEVSIGAAEGRGELQVRDTGPGIPGDVLPHLFEPFFTTREQGLGLGLSLSESLAVAMDGSLDAANATPRGAVFRLRLPLAVVKKD